MDNVFRNVLIDEILNDPVDDVENLVHQFPINGINNILDGIEEFILAFGDDLNGDFHINPRNNAPVTILNYFEEVIPQYDDNQFYSHFRMPRESIMELENVIRLHTLDMNNDIPLQKKILLTIWILATPDSFRSVADRFGLSKSIAHGVFKEIIIILADLLPQYVRWPDGEECEAIKDAFSAQQGFPGIIGAIDGCHIEIMQPPGNANDYYNRKETHSIILQGTCDHTGKFIDVLIGRPGRAHDASVFKSSSLYTRLTNAENPLLPPNQHILGDSAYPLMLNLLTPFKDNGHLTPQKLKYNTKHASCRSIIERAFGQLKGKFRRLHYLHVKSIRMANLMVSAACTLHNFILIQNGGNVRDICQRVNHHDLNAEIEMEEVEAGVDDLNINAIQKRNNIMNLL